MREPIDAIEEMTRLNNELIATQRELFRKNQELMNMVQKYETLLSEIKVLKGLIPICMYCRQIRDESDQWVMFEEYIQKNTDSAFSHGICESCLHKVESGDRDV